MGILDAPVNITGKVDKATWDANVLGKVLTIGTSITNGVGASVDSLKYSNRIAAHLPAMLQGMTVSVAYNGVNGSTSAEMLARLKAALELNKPTFVFIETSINDTRTDKAITPAQTEANMRAMVALVRAYGATPIVGTSAKLDSSVYGGVYDAGSEAEAVEANTLVKAAMAALGVQVVDLYAMYSSPSYLSDGLHPDDTGHDHWGQNIAGAIAARPLIVFPSTYTARDTFTRANSSATMGTTPTGAYTWTYAGSTAPTWGINTNQAYAAVISGEGYAFIDDALANFTMEARLATKVNAGAGFVFRYADTANFWLVYPNASGNWALLKKVANAYTTVQTGGSVAANGDVVSIVANGNSITVNVNGVAQLSTTDAFQSTATKKGLWSGNTGTAARFDDFSTRV